MAKIPHVHEAAPVLDACEGQRPASRYRAHQREKVRLYPRPVDERWSDDDELEPRARGHRCERILGRELGLAVSVVRRTRLRRADVDEAPQAFTRGDEIMDLYRVNAYVQESLGNYNLAIENRF